MTSDKTEAERREHMPRRDWTLGEVTTLTRRHTIGAVALASLMGRSVGSVKAKARELGVSLRIPGSRRGLILGQPRAMHLSAEVKTGNVRNLVLSGRVDMKTMLARIELDGQGKLGICPHCARRPVTVKNTGLCGPCHKALLIEHLNVELATYEAQKQQWVAQQRVSRARKAVKAHAAD